MSFGPPDPHIIDIDEFLKLDFNRVIDQLKVDNDILRRRLEVMERHISKQQPPPVSKTAEGDGKDGGSAHKVDRVMEQKIDQLLRTVEFYKNETICLKNFNESLTDKYNLENKYLYNQVTFYVEALKNCEDQQAYWRSLVNRYKAAFEEQQLKTMACFKYLQQIKTKYEEQLEHQRILIRLLDDRFKRYFVQRAGPQSRDVSGEMKQLIPENWGLQEKIEYLELKFINENRDKILNRLLFENEQLRTLIENDFYQNSEYHSKKRIKTHEDYFLDYLKRDSVHSRLIQKEKARLAKQKQMEKNRQDNAGEYTESNPEEDDDEEEDEENVNEENKEDESEAIADDEEGSSSTMSEILHGSITDLIDLMEPTKEVSEHKKSHEEKPEKSGRKDDKKPRDVDGTDEVVLDKTDSCSKQETSTEQEYQSTVPVVRSEDRKFNTNDSSRKQDRMNMEYKKSTDFTEAKCGTTIRKTPNEPDHESQLENTDIDPDETNVDSKEDELEPLDSHKKLYTSVINQLKHTRAAIKPETTTNTPKPTSRSFTDREVVIRKMKLSDYEKSQDGARKLEEENAHNDCNGKQKGYSKYFENFGGTGKKG
ncbi:hypothetical protein M8J77_013422 [Diaphorina citri]|nr:hypothetical protein M8J77_013422 [Diaphorina citri]